MGPGASRRGMGRRLKRALLGVTGLIVFLLAIGFGSALGGAESFNHRYPGFIEQNRRSGPT